MALMTYWPSDAVTEVSKKAAHNSWGKTTQSGIRHRKRVIYLFSNEASALRLQGALLIKQSGNCQPAETTLRWIRATKQGSNMIKKTPKQLLLPFVYGPLDSEPLPA